MKRVFVLLLISLMLLGAVISIAAAETITIASTNHAEPQILAEAVKFLIEDQTNITVEHVKNFQGSSLLHSAFLSDDVQMYISWTGTQFTGVLEMEVTDEWKDREKVQAYVQEKFDVLFDAYWFDAFGFNNTYAIAVRRKWADDRDVTTISDLEPYASDMTIGMDVTFRERIGDGYSDMLDLYGFSFQRPVSMDYGLLYRSVAVGSVDAAVAYSTDGRVASNDLVILEDNLNFFPPYDGALVVANSLLEEHPEIKEIVEPLIGKFDDQTIAYYNQLVDVEHMDVYEVAKLLVEDLI